MLKISRNQKTIQCSVILLGLMNSLPVHAADFGNFNNTANFAQMNSFSSSPRAQVAPVGNFSNNISTTNLAPISAQTATTVPMVSTSAVFTPTSSVMNPAATVMSPINSIVVTPNLGATQAQGNILSSAVYTASPLSGVGMSGNLPGNIGTFNGITLPNATGSVKGVFGMSGLGSAQPFHNVAIFSTELGTSSESAHGVASGATRGLDQAVQNVGQAAAGVGQVCESAGEGAGNAAGNAVQSIARLTDDKEHRPEDSHQTPVITGLPQLGSALSNTIGSVSNIIISVQQQAQLTLFSSTNQVLQGGRGQIISGEAGTLLSQELNTIILHKGRLTIDSGEETTTVKTAKGEVKIQPSTIAIIESQVGKPLQVLALFGKDDAVSVNTNATRGIEVKAKAGQQLLVSDEEMIPVDGAEIVVAGGVELRSNVQKSDIAVDDVVEQYQRRAGKTARFGGHINPNDTTAASSQKRFRAELWDLLDDKAGVPLQMVAQPGAQIQQDEHGNTKLLYGAVFVAAKADTTIDTIFARVNIKRNGLSMIETDEKICRIKSFSGPGDLQVSMANSVTELSPGQELLAAKHAPSDVEIIPADAIARRARSQDLVDGKHIRLNDFSMLSMLRYPGYRKMIAEADKSGKLNEKLLKTAVVVEMVTKGRGQYAYSSLYQQKDDKQQQLSSATRAGKAN